MVIGTFDPEQLGAVDAGGIFPLIAARHGSYRLTEVRRFNHAWEREASLRLREGDVTALAEYAGAAGSTTGRRTGYSMTRVSLYLNGFLDGQGSPADGHVERDRGPAVRAGPRAAGRARHGSAARPRSRSRTATRPAAAT